MDLDLFLSIEKFDYHKEHNVLIAPFSVLEHGITDDYESIPKKITVIGKRHNRQFSLVSNHKFQYGFGLNYLFPGSFYWFYVTQNFYVTDVQDEYAVVLYTKE